MHNNHEILNIYELNIHFNSESHIKHDIVFYICLHCEFAKQCQNKNHFSDHIIDDHEYNIDSSSFKKRQDNANKIIHVRRHVHEIIVFKTNDFVIVKGKLFDQNINICIDTDDAVNLIDQSLLKTVLKHIKPIIIKNFDDQQINDRIADLDLQIGNKTFKIIVYVIRGLLLKLLLNMNVFVNSDYDINVFTNKQLLRVDSNEYVTIQKTEASANNHHYVIANLQGESAAVFRSLNQMKNSMDPGNQKRLADSRRSTHSPRGTLNARSTPALPPSRTPSPRQCRRCHQQFPSGNALHQHLPSCSTPRKQTTWMTSNWRRI